MRFNRRWKYTILMSALLLACLVYMAVMFSAGCEIAYGFGRRNHWEC